jgi:hypothetical protein
MMSDVTELLRQALRGVQESEDALARTLGRIRRRERRRRIVLAGVTLLVFAGAGAGLLVRLDSRDVDRPAGQPASSAPSGSSAATPSTAARRPALFVPATRPEGDRAVLPITFPDGSTAELVYPADLDLARLGLQPDVSIVDRRNPAARSPLVFLHRGAPGPDVLEGTQPVQRPTTRTGRPVEVWQARAESAVTPNQAYWVVYKVGSWTVLAPAADLTVATDVARQLEPREASDGFVVVDAGAPLVLSHEFGEGGGVQLAIGDRNPRPDQVDAGNRFRLIVLSPMRGACQGEGLSPSGDSASKCLRAAGTRGAVLATISGDRRFVKAVFDALEVKKTRLVS